MVLVHFGISLNMTELVGDIYINLLIVSVVDVPTIFLSTLALQNVGRKVSLIVSFLLMAATSMIVIAMELIPGKYIKDIILMHYVIPTTYLQILLQNYYWEYSDS